MYTSKSFKEMVPESFLTKSEILFKNSIQKRLNDLSIINSIKDTSKQTFYNRVKRERLSDEEISLINIINISIKKRYIDSIDVEYVNNVEDILNEIFQQTSVIYGWYSDTQVFKNEKQKSFEKAKEYEENYWFFMEWQSDLFFLTMAIFNLCGKKLPDKLKIDIKILMQNYDILCGGNLIYSKDELMNRLYDQFDTIYAWTYIEEESNWINKDMTHSKKETFESHLKFWIKLIKFVEDYTIESDLDLWVYEDFQKILTNKYLKVL